MPGDAPAAAAPAPTPAAAPEAKAEPAPAPAPAPSPAPAAASGDDRIKASPLAKRIAAAKGIDLATIKGTGPGGRIVKADVEGAKPGQAAAPAPQAASAPAASAPTPAPAAAAAPFTTDIPHEASKLSNMRTTIARRLTEAKQTIPHIYLTVDAPPARQPEQPSRSLTLSAAVLQSSQITHRSSRRAGPTMRHVHQRSGTTTSSA